MRALQPLVKLNYTLYLLKPLVIVNRIYRSRDLYIMTDAKYVSKEI